MRNKLKIFEQIQFSMYTHTHTHTHTQIFLSLSLSLCILDLCRFIKDFDKIFKIIKYINILLPISELIHYYSIVY